MTSGLIRIALLGALTAPCAASAADWSPPAPLLIWTGPYAGLNAGAVLPAGAPGLAPLSGAAGFLGGGQFGYNWRFAERAVIGFETDIQGVTARESQTQAVRDPLRGPAPFTFLRAESSLDFFGSARARLGFLAAPSLMTYVTGGFAYGEVEARGFRLSLDPAGALAPTFGAASVGELRSGWTAGAGLEWMFMRHWSAKLEYLYYDLGRAALRPSAGQGFAWAFAPATSRFDGHIVRAGANYHFDWGAAPPPSR